MDNGSNTSTSTVTSGAEPWGPSQGHLKNVLGEAGSMFNSGQLYSTWADDGGMKKAGLYGSGGYNPDGGFFAGQRFARPDQMEMAGAYNLKNIAGGGLGDNVTAYAKRMAGGGGLNQDQRSAMRRTENVGGMSDPYRGNLNQMASGQLMKAGGNPYLEDMIAKASEDARSAVNLNASRMGRYDSGVHQGAVADAVMDASLGARMQNYENEAGRMLQANQMGSGMYGADANRRLQSAQQQFGMGQQGYQNMQGVMGLGQQQGQAMQDAGRYFSGLNQQKLEEAMANFNETQRVPREALEWYSAITQGAGRLGQTGTETTVAQGPSGPGMGQQLLGTGLSFLSGLF